MKNRKFALSLIIAMMLLVSLIGIAYAWSITVDGDPSDWGSMRTSTAFSACDGGVGSTCGTSGFPLQPAEPDIPGNVNVVTVTMVANQTTWYALVATDPVSPTTRFDPISAGANNPILKICLDTDNNTSTGATVVPCNNMLGVDRVLDISTLLGPLAIRVNNCSAGTCSFSKNLFTAATANNFTEFSIALSDLGINPGTCVGSLTTQWTVYFDNQDNPPDDTVPNSTKQSYTQQCPTAVTLSNVSAQSNQSFPVMPMALGLVGIVGTTSALVFIKRRK